jgi:methionyl-tRNA formyltransferase
MDKGVDTGPILNTVRIAPGNGKSFEQIRAKLEVEMVGLMLDGVKRFRDRTITRKTQEAQDGRQYYVMYPRIKEFAKLQLLRQMKNR